MGMLKRAIRVLSGVLACGVALAAGPTEAEFAACVRRLGDPDVDARDAAFTRILDWGVADPAGTLKRLPASHDDIEIQNRCHELRSRIPWEPVYRAVAARAGGDPDLLVAARDLFPEPTIASLAALAQIAAVRERKPVASAMLVEILRAGCQGTARVQVISHLGSLGCKEAAPAIVPFLTSKDADFNLRCQAAHAIGALRNHGVTGEILLLLDDANPETRQVALMALGSLQDKSASDRIARLLLEDDAMQVRFRAMNALCQLDMEKAASVVGALLADPEPALRSLAVNQIGRLKDLDPSLLARAEKLLADKTTQVRCAVLNLLQQTGDPAKTPLVAPLLKDPDRVVRNAATNAIARCGGPDAPALLTGLLRDTDPDIRSCALRHMAQWKDDSCAARIAEMLDDPEEPVRISAACALASLFGQSWHEVDQVKEAKAWWAGHVKEGSPEKE